jgi:hypothetical protein
MNFRTFMDPVGEYRDHKSPLLGRILSYFIRCAEGGTMGEKWLRNFAESGDFHVTFGFFYMP